MILNYASHSRFDLIRLAARRDKIHPIIRWYVTYSLWDISHHLSSSYSLIEKTHATRQYASAYMHVPTEGTRGKYENRSGNTCKVFTFLSWESPLLNARNKRGVSTLLRIWPWQFIFLRHALHNHGRFAHHMHLRRAAFSIRCAEILLMISAKYGVSVLL